MTDRVSQAQGPSKSRSHSCSDGSNKVLRDVVLLSADFMNYVQNISVLEVPLTTHIR